MQRTQLASSLRSSVVIISYHIIHIHSSHHNKHNQSQSSLSLSLSVSVSVYMYYFNLTIIILTKSPLLHQHHQLRYIHNRRLTRRRWIKDISGFEYLPHVWHEGGDDGEVREFDLKFFDTGKGSMEIIYEEGVRMEVVTG